jgi:hypothetical protein
MAILWGFIVLKTPKAYKMHIYSTVMLLGASILEASFGGVFSVGIAVRCVRKGRLQHLALSC